MINQVIIVGEINEFLIKSSTFWSISRSIHWCEHDGDI